MTIQTQALILENTPAYAVKYQPRTPRALVVVEFGTPDGGVFIGRESHLRIVDTIAAYYKKTYGKIVSVRVDNYNGVTYWADAQYTEEE